MERNREPRRGTMTAMNSSGRGLSRRRRRDSSSYKESPEDGGVELTETSRLRDRVSRKDRDGCSQRKRCQRQRLLHGNSREEGEESSEESSEDNEDEDDDAAVRHWPESLTTFSSSQHQLQPNHHSHHYNHHHQQHQRKSFPPSVERPPAMWTADEMIGVSVPRKARTSVGRGIGMQGAGGAE